MRKIYIRKVDLQKHLNPRDFHILSNGYLKYIVDGAGHQKGNEYQVIYPYLHYRFLNEEPCVIYGNLLPFGTINKDSLVEITDRIKEKSPIPSWSI